MIQTPTISIYLICHNRVEDARKAIISILLQTDAVFNFIVSDNSTNNELKQLMKTEFSSVLYVQRKTDLTAIAHFNICISEVETDYFCLFHDDDIMHPNFIFEFKKLIKNYPNAIAIGANAYIEKFGEILRKPSFLTIFNPLIINNSTSLARRYFSRLQSGIAPFPSYIYNKKLTKKEQFPLSGGKYADVTWLLNLAQKGIIVWTQQALMTYRLHDTNDGNVESRSDRLIFLAYLKCHRNLISKEILQDYRCSFIYKKIMLNDASIYGQRRIIASSFLTSYRYARCLRLSTYRSLLNRLIIKIKGF